MARPAQHAKQLKPWVHPDSTDPSKIANQPPPSPPPAPSPQRGVQVGLRAATREDGRAAIRQFVYDGAADALRGGRGWKGGRGETSECDAVPLPSSGDRQGTSSGYRPTGLLRERAVSWLSIQCRRVTVLAGEGLLRTGTHWHRVDRGGAMGTKVNGPHLTMSMAITFVPPVTTAFWPSSRQRRAAAIQIECVFRSPPCDQTKSRESRPRRGQTMWLKYARNFLRLYEWNLVNDTRTLQALKNEEGRWSVTGRP